MIELQQLTTLHRRNPVGIDETPEFSWRLVSDQRDTIQISYRITVSDETGTVWDSGDVISDQQSFVEYLGKPLRSRTEYEWSVIATTNHGQTRTLSASFETGLYTEDWSARWVESSITRPVAQDWSHGTQPPPIEFLRGFDARADVRRARLYATALGVYRPSINGVRPDDRELAPEFSVYRSRLYYQTYDVTELIREGNNVLSLYVGDGWYFCPATRSLTHEQRTMPAVLFQMEISYEDGEVQIFGSDGSETCRTGPVRSSDLFWGERYDATEPWGPDHPVRLIDLGYDNLVAQPLDPIRPAEVLPAVSVVPSDGESFIVDFGQIVAGRARVRVHAPAGAEVSLEHFETLTVDGKYFNGTFAGQKDVYVSDGTTREYEPLFTFHGFRYIRVVGLTRPAPEDFNAVLLTTPKALHAKFRTSDPRLNRLHENILWSQRNNMMSIPTDCPTREKAGFTGDIQVYTPTAFANEDMTSFLTAWLRNLATDQLADGTVPMVVPFTLPYERLSLARSEEYGTEGVTGIAGWSDAAVLVPWEMYRATGNTLVLKEAYASMKAWCDYVIDTARTQRGGADIPEQTDEYLWNTGFHFGEWLIPSQHQKGGEWETTKASAFYVAPFFGFRSVETFAKIAQILNRVDDQRSYSKNAELMKDAIQQALMANDAELPTKLMGAYVLAFAFDLIPEDRREAYGARLVELIDGNNGLLDTGFLSTPYLLDVLVSIGRADLAMSMLWERRQPSWLFQVDMGATAIWENWDAISPDGTPGVSSLNHYAFGCVDDWICREIAGIQAASPGYKTITIAPRVSSGLDWCERTLVTEYGEVAVQWTQEVLRVSIPANTAATIHWGGEVHHVGSGHYRFAAQASSKLKDSNEPTSTRNQSVTSPPVRNSAL